MLVPHGNNPSNTASASSPARYEPLRAEFLRDPYPVLARLRTERPVYWDRRFGWVVSRYVDVTAGLRDPRLSSQPQAPGERIPAHLEAVADDVRAVRYEQSLWMLCSDDPRHARLRSVFSGTFGQRLLQRMRSRVQQQVNSLLDEVEGQPEVDVVAALASPLPTMVIADLLGVPVGDRQRFQQWSDDINAGSTWTAPSIQRARRGHETFAAYLRPLLAARRAQPTDDLLSLLVAAEGEGRLSEEELLATCVLLLFAGHKTTTYFIGNAVLAVLRHPDQLQRLRAEPTLTSTAIEELLRYDSPFQAVPRRAMVDFELRGQPVRRGDQLLFLLGSANRDPDQFHTPDQLDLGRRENRHVAFSLGPHFCLGAMLARLEGQIALETLLRRFPRLELATDSIRWQPNVLLRGFESLTVRLGD